MTAIHETAYPRLKTEYSLEELTAVYTCCCVLKIDNRQEVVRAEN